MCKIDPFRGHLKVAQQICDEFGVLSSSVCGVDIELKTEASVRRARTLLAAKQFGQVLDSLACFVYMRSMHFILFWSFNLPSTLYESYFRPSLALQGSGLLRTLSILLIMPIHGTDRITSIYDT